MATRYPLVIDTDDNNKIKEIPSGDDLNLSGNNIVNAINITASGTLTASSIALDTTTILAGGNPLSPIAFTGNYSDLNNPPTIFSGSFLDLTDKPNYARTMEELDNVDDTLPSNGQILIYNTALGRYLHDNIPTISNSSIEDLTDVAFGSLFASDVLKYVNGAWTNSKVAFSELTGTSDVVLQGSDLSGNLKGSVFADDSSTLVDGVNASIVGKINNTEASFTGTVNFTGATVTGLPGLSAITLEQVVQTGSSASIPVTFNAGIETNTITPINPSIAITINGTLIANSIQGNINGSIFGDDSTLLVDAVSNIIPAENLQGILPSLDGSNLFNITTTNSLTIDYGNDGTTNTREVNDLDPVLQEDGTDLILELVVSPGYVQNLIELNISCINITDQSSECHIMLQKSIDNGVTWQNLKSAQTTGVYEATSGVYQNLFGPACVKWLDVHGQNSLTTIKYRFVNNSAAIMNSISNDIIRIYYGDKSCIAHAREVK